MTTDDPGGPARQGSRRRTGRLPGHRDDAGRGEREVEGRGPTAVDEHERREQVREHAIEPGSGAADARAERTAAGRGEHTLRATVGADHEQQRLVVAVLQPLDRVAGDVIAFDDDRVQRIAERGRDRDLGAGFDLDVVDERPDDTVDRPTIAAPPAAACAASSADISVSARARQRVASASVSRHARVGVVQLLFGGAALLRLEGHLRCDFGVRVELGAHARGLVLGGLGLGHLRRERVEIAATPPRAARALRRARMATAAARCSSWARSRCTSWCAASASAGRRGRRELGDALLGRVDLGARRRERREVGIDRGELLAQRCRFGDERLDDAFVGDRGELALEPAVAFGDEVREAAGRVRAGLGAREQVGDIVVAGDRERALGVEHVAVEPAQADAHILFLRCELAALGAAPLFPDSQRVDLATGEVQADRLQLGDETVVPARRVGLAFERPQPAAHLAQQVGEAQQVALGRLEPALRLLAALAELQDAGRFLDDRPAILGPRVEHGVELTLADDHVLLAADARVGEQLLDVEQPARRAVDHVLRLTRAEQRAGDRDLGELDRQQSGGVVDRERHLGPAERRPIGGAREDDVVHLGAAQRAGTLGAEHPRDRVDDVRLARAVRPDDDADAGLELERRLVREGLEALQRQRLQEHAVPSPEPVVPPRRCLGNVAAPRGGPAPARSWGQRMVKRGSPVGASSSVVTAST